MLKRIVNRRVLGSVIEAIVFAVLSAIIFVGTLPEGINLVSILGFGMSYELMLEARDEYLISGVEG